ncbi:hypothetical protein DLREEDagrD3_12410 [Denitratisoma sp. agr-D3]
MRHFLVPLLFSTALALPAAAHATDWDGYSWGWQLGAIQQDSKTRTRVERTASAQYFDAQDADLFAAQGNGKLLGGDWAGGLKAGYSKAYGNVIAGIDLRLDTGFEQSNRYAATYISQPGVRFSVDQKVSADWTLSLLPRLGWAWENKQVYVTAGVAASRVSLETKFQDNYIWGGVGPGASGSSKASKTMTGVVLGFGGEYALDKATSLSFHYLYTDFGSLNTTTSTRHPFVDPANLGQLGSKVDLRTHTLMVGYTYRFQN